MKNIILTLLSIPKVGKKSVGYFIKYMQEIPKNENDIIDIFIVLVIANLITMFIPISEKTQDYYKELQTTQKKMYEK